MWNWKTRSHLPCLCSSRKVQGVYLSCFVCQFLNSRALEGDCNVIMSCNRFISRDQFTRVSAKQRQSRECSKDIQEFDEESCQYQLRFPACPTGLAEHSNWRYAEFTRTANVWQAHPNPAADFKRTPGTPASQRCEREKAAKERSSDTLFQPKCQRTSKSYQWWCCSHETASLRWKEPMDQGPSWTTSRRQILCC